jgi:hypothetical protein
MVSIFVMDFDHDFHFFIHEVLLLKDPKGTALNPALFKIYVKKCFILMTNIFIIFI